MKLIEAAAHGVPIVCTTELVRQLGWTPGTYDAQDTRMVQDANIEYRFHRRFALYASVRNLANEPRPLVTVSANAPAYTRPRTFTYYGALWTMGVKGTF